MKISSSNLTSLKSFVVPTLILVTIVLIIPFAFVPLLDNVKKTNDALREQQERLGGLSDKIEVLDSLDEADINEKLALAEQALPVGKELAPLIVGIQSLAISSNLLIEGINLSPGEVATSSASTEAASSKKAVGSSNPKKDSKETKDAMFLQLNLRGKISAVQEFLKQLQSSKRLSFADEVNLQSSEERDFEIKIQLKTPFRAISLVKGDILAEPVPELSEKNLKTLEAVDRFLDITNIQINEVRTNVVKDPFRGR